MQRPLTRGYDRRVLGTVSGGFLDCMGSASITRRASCSIPAGTAVRSKVPAAIGLQKRQRFQPVRVTADDPSAELAYDRVWNTRDYDFGFDFDAEYPLQRRKEPTQPLILPSLENSPDSLQAYLDFRMELSKPDQEIDLLKCALLIAKHAHPELDVRKCYKKVDVMAQTVLDLHDMATERRFLIQSINKVLYTIHGFSGNSDNYYDPDNSCINKVLERKLGSPAALALLYTEVAARIGLQVWPVFLPSHTFLKPDLPRSHYLIDPFNSGQLCTAGVAHSRISYNWGYALPRFKLQPSDVEHPPRWPRKELLIRLLHDTRESYWGPLMRGNMILEDAEAIINSLEHALMVSRMLRLLDPGSVCYVRDEGYILCSLGRRQEGRELLMRYLHEVPNAEDVDTVRLFL